MLYPSAPCCAPFGDGGSGGQHRGEYSLLLLFLPLLLSLSPQLLYRANYHICLFPICTRPLVLLVILILQVLVVLKPQVILLLLLVKRVLLVKWVLLGKRILLVKRVLQVKHVLLVKRVLLVNTSTTCENEYY